MDHYSSGEPLLEDKEMQARSDTAIHEDDDEVCVGVGGEETHVLVHGYGSGCVRSRKKAFQSSKTWKEGTSNIQTVGIRCAGEEKVGAKVKNDQRKWPGEVETQSSHVTHPASCKNLSHVLSHMSAESVSPVRKAKVWDQFNHEM
eukprot:1161745-Pelagomonas_calceolata.AAC.19